MREDASAGGEVQNYVNGGWRSASGDDGRDVVDPATRDTVASVTYSTTADIDDAVNARKAAFETWRSTPVGERIQPLFELKRLFEANQNDIAEALVCEHGKTFNETKGELRRGIENVEVACGVPSMMQAGHLPNAASGTDETAVRKPLGVFAAVMPFNFPGMIPLWFLPCAVTTGNVFVLKSSEKTPVTTRLIFELVDGAGLPDGVVQLVNGGADTVNAPVEHDGIEGISFVESTPVAKHVYKTAAAHGKRVQAQDGAKNHIVVAASANLDLAVEQAIGSAFANTGQRCLANPVAVIEDVVCDEPTECVVDIAARMTLDNDLSEDVNMGPLIPGVARDHVKEHVEAGVEEGATLLHDGRDADVPAEGSFLGPIIFSGVSPDDTTARKETFGPVLALVRADDFDHAVEVVNRSEFGSASSLFTGRGADVKRFRHEVEAGNLAMNAGTAAPMVFFHFGSWKGSFFGDPHAQGDDATHFYTDKTVYIERWSDA